MNPSLSNHIKHAIILCLCAGMLSGPAGKGDIYGGDVRFRDFREDRDRLERTARSVKEEERLELWERAVEGGREALRAEWERDAEQKIDRTLLEEGDPARRGELEHRRDEARADWEQEAAALVADEKGKWFASRQGLLNLRPNEETFRELMRRAKEAVGGKDGAAALDSWDGVVGPEKDHLAREAEAELNAWTVRLRSEGAVLDAAARESYEREIIAVVGDVRKAYLLEANALVYRERNGVIADLYFDRDSLKFKSGSESARAAYDLVALETERTLAAEEAKIAGRDTGRPEGADASDIEKLAGAWNEGMERLVGAGLEAWRKAQDELLARMAVWRSNAAGALQEGEKAWEEALKRLERAREEWRVKIAGEIERGLAGWKEKEDELSANITAAHADLFSYLDTESEAWNGQRAELYGMAADGLAAWGEAWDSVRWLTGKSSEYQQQGFYTGYSETVNHNGSVLERNKGWLPKTLTGEFDLSVHAVKFLQESRTIYPAIPPQRSCSYYNGKQRCSYHGRDHLSDSEVKISITPVLSNTTYNSRTGEVTEYYTINMSTVVGWDWYTRRRDGWWEAYLNSHPNEKKFGGWVTYSKAVSTVARVMKADTPIEEKSRYYYYVTQQSDMEVMEENLARQLAETEAYLHSRLMRGEDGGAGYLVNAEGSYGLRYAGGELSRDPYLMTGAEQSFELARKERVFWEERLLIAEDVLKYASPELYGADNPYAPGGRREAAGVTEGRVDAAKAAMDAALAELDDARAAAAGLVAQMTDVKNQYPALLQAADERYPAVARARADYEEKKAAAILAGNEVTGEMLQAVEDAGTVLKDAEEAYNEAVRLVEETRARYETLNNQYRAAMDVISARGDDYKDADFAYERACAVWEYAGTPYLMDAAVKAPFLESGTVPGEGVEDYGGLRMPDAKEYYEYVLGIYNEKIALFEEARAAVENQETVEHLLADGNYTAVRGPALQAMEGGAPPEDLAAALAAYLEFGYNEAFEGRRDLTVVLREQEGFLWELSRTARERYEAALGTGNSEGAEAARGLYGVVMNALVNAVDDAVVRGLIGQKRVFQEASWAGQREKFAMRKRRWAETAGYIMNRGEREWQLRMADFNRERARWKNEAEKEIGKGEREYAGALEEFNREMIRWRSEAVKKESEGAAKRAIADAEKKARELLERLGLNLPGGLVFKVDSDTLNAKWFPHTPSGMGALMNTIGAIDTAALFNGSLGLDGGMAALREACVKQMDEFAGRMATMRTARMAEAAYESFQAMIAQFHEQIGNVNMMSYDITGNDIRGSFKAPFNRETDRNTWSIRVIADRSVVTGSKRETLRFDDWLNYVYRLPLLKPLKGLNGGQIDFENPYTCEHLSTAELEAYAKIEEELMRKEMERILGEGGEFTRHQGDEFTRLQNEFAHASGKYQKGRALGKMKLYSVPIVPGGPNGIVVGAIGAGIIGGPWAAFAASTLFTTIQMADGSMKWEQGAFNIAAGAAVTGLTFGAGSYLGGFQGQLAGTVGSTLMGGFEMSPTGRLSYEYEKMDDLDTWRNAGINLGIATLANNMNAASGTSAWGKLQGALLSGTVTTVGTKLTTGDWDWASGMGNALGAWAGNAVGAHNAYTQALINNVAGCAFRNMLGSNEQFSWESPGQINALQLALNDTFNKQKPAQKTEKENSGPAGDPLDLPGATRGHNDTETLLGGLWTSVRNGFVNTSKQIVAGIEAMGRGVASAWDGMGRFAERMGNWVTGEGYNTNREVAVNAAMKELGKQEAVAAAFGAFNELSRGYDTAVNAAIGEYERINDAYRVAINEYESIYSEALKGYEGYNLAVKIATDQIVNRYTVNINEVKTDAMALNQEGSNGLISELNKAMKKIKDNEGLDANKIKDSVCVTASMYILLKNSGANVKSFSEFYADNVNKGLIRGKDAFITQDNQANIISQYEIDGNKIELVRIKDYSEFLNNPKGLGVVRYSVGNGGHNMNVYNQNGDLYMADTGWSSNIGRRVDYVVRRNNFQYYQYIKIR